MKSLCNYKLAAILIFSALLFPYCRSKESTKRKNEIGKVVFASGGCFGHCPILTIEIDSSLNYRFLGGRYTDSIGFYKGKVDERFWDTLNIMFETVHFKDLDSSYQFSADDLSTLTTLYYGNKVKKIQAQSASLPDSVERVLRCLMYSYRRIPLIHSTDSQGMFRLQYPFVNPPPLPRFKTPRIEK